MLKIWRKKSFLNINVTNLCLNGLKWTVFYHHHFQSLSTVPRACTWVFDVIFASPCTISMFRRAAIVLYFVDLHTETVRMVPHAHVLMFCATHSSLFVIPTRLTSQFRIEQSSSDTSSCSWKKSFYLISRLKTEKNLLHT